jgi:hypothetical protein
MEIMTQLTEGMHVVDSDGKDVGKVRDFQAGDPEGFIGIDGAAPDASLMGSVGPLIDADVPQAEAERLSRLGWVRIHRGILHHDRFVAADGLDRIDDEKLYLKPGVHPR